MTSSGAPTSEQDLSPSRMRSPHSLAASFAAVCGVSVWVTPTKTSRPGPSMAPTTRPSTATLAWLTRCTTARTSTSLRARAICRLSGPWPAPGWRMGNMTGYQVVPIGWVESPLKDRAQAPRQGDEGAPDAWLVFQPEVAERIRDLAPGAEIIVLTWLDRAARDVLVTRPRDDPARPPTGVFSTRSPDRPNPIGLHRVRIVATDGLRVLVRPLEALDKTPVLDIKPVLDKTTER